MSTEVSDLKRRAARHAALADAVRLRIVDLLLLTDLSPSRLQVHLEIPSNLLAHHLNVLADAGVIERGRSEADRRRSYVRLAPDAFEDLVPTASDSASRVVFVCTANSARSQLAEALWRQRSDIPVASAGTHPAATIDPGAVDVAERHGLALAGRPKALSDVLAHDDFLISVCDVAHEEIPGQIRAHWSIPDPVRAGTADAFTAAYEELALRIDRLVPRLSAA